MKKADIKKISDIHTNRLLISTTICFVLLISLIFIHKAQLKYLFVETRVANLVLAIVCAVAVVALAVWMISKKKWFLSEYVGLAAVMAVCFYGMHGVRILVKMGLTAQIMKTLTFYVVGAYFVGTFIFHTVAPKFLAKK